MATKPEHSKWQTIYNRSLQVNPNDPVDTPEEVAGRILNTQMNIPDTVEEVDAQRNNLGPKDTKVEHQSPDLEPPEPRGPRP